jgi:hypothetical protein
VFSLFLRFIPQRRLPIVLIYLSQLKMPFFPLLKISAGTVINVLKEPEEAGSVWKTT